MTSFAFAQSYGYPLKNPYFATAIGTPAELEYPTREISYPNIEKLKVHPDRKVPPVFWHGNTHRVGIDIQGSKKPAPLIFLLSGTGSNFQSGKTRFLRNLFCQSGFHVISLSSPTSDEFITSASHSSRPGFVSNDVEDLYRIMRQAYSKVENKIKVSEFYIAGFSMGALHASFLGELDSRRQQFGFDKIMMINPPVRLYDSAQRLDQFLERNLPNGIENVGTFAEGIFNRYAPVFNQSGGSEIDSEFLFALQERLPLTTEELEIIIGLAFRLAASSMTFASDVMTRSGYVVHPDEQLTTGDTLTGYFKQSLHWGFTDYFDRILLPYVQQSDPSMTINSLKQQLSLESIRDYLASTKTLAAVTNSDDFILNQADLEFLENTLDERLTVYPYGGHGGNFTYRDNVEHLLKFFDAEPTP